ncbi:hypothetical protein LCGC14_2750730 [marine sediment metagenome]|uniref:Uncharacterized protein n=1 Tax=marine sediment metagenome TaxID=412755 RepID=A0A0F9BTI1_9ZZZZ
MTRQEHLQWCKNRALEYLNSDDLPSAVASMLSDLQKHPDTKLSTSLFPRLGMMYVMNQDRDGVRRFIEGFN